MAKSDKETPKKSVSQKPAGIKKSSAKPKKAVEDDFELEDDEATLKGGKKALSSKNLSLNEDDDFVNEIDEDDNNFNKGEDDDDWDPDFNEFDLPKSSKKTSFKKSAANNDDDYKVDDEFKDLFGSGSSSKKYKNSDDDDY